MHTPASCLPWVWASFTPSSQASHFAATSRAFSGGSMGVPKEFMRRIFTSGYRSRSFRSTASKKGSLLEWK